jgi:hypothetical protein
VVGGEELSPPERDRHRQVVALGPGGHGGDGARRPAGSAQQHHRPPRLRQHRPQARDVIPGRGRRGRNDARRVRHGRDVVEHVLRQGDHDGARAALHRDPEGPGEDLRDARGVVDLHRPLGDAAEHLPVIDLLERLAIPHPPGDLADEQDHRRRILAGDVHAGGRRWWRPGPRVTKQMPGRPVSLPAASAMIAAPPSCRQTSTSIPLSRRASSTAR